MLQNFPRVGLQGCAIGGGVDNPLQFFAPLETNVYSVRALDATVTEPGAGSVRMVEDHEGILRRVNSGELRFKGARRVENLILDKDLTNAGWTKDAGVGTAFDSATGISSVTNFTAGVGTAIQDSVGGAEYAGVQFTWSLEIKTVDDVGNEVKLRLVDNAGSADPVDVDVTLTADWVRYSMTLQMASDSIGVRPSFVVAVSNPTDTFQVRKMQLEEVSGASVTAPSEYVDEAVDYGAGNGVVGVKYFTTANGNTVDGSGVVTEDTGAAIAAATLKGYFAEPGVDNELAQPLDFSNVAWSKVNTSVSGTLQSAPDGRVAAYELIEDDTGPSSSHQLTDAASYSAGADVTFSVYAKRGSGTRDLMLQISAATGDFRATFDLGDGTVSDEVAGGSGYTKLNTGTIDMGNGWYRCWIAFTTSTDTSGTFLCQLWNTTLSYDGDGTSSIYLFGAQVEQSSNHSTLYPLNGTRVADNNLKYHIDNIGVLEGSAEIEFANPASSTEAATNLQTLLSTGNNNGRVALISAFAGRNEGVAVGVTTFSDAGLTYASGDVLRHRVRWSATGNVFNVSLKDPSGTVKDDSTPATFTTLTAGAQLRVLDVFGSNWGHAGNGETGISVKNVKIWNTDKGDAWLNEV